MNGARFDLHARIDDSDEPVITLSSADGTIEILEEGRIVLHFTHSMTRSAEWERANYDLQLNKAGKRTTLLYGKIKLIAFAQAVGVDYKELKKLITQLQNAMEIYDSSLEDI